LTDFFAQDEIEAIARETSFVQRCFAKIDGLTFLNTLMFTGFNQNELSLNDLSCQLRDKYKIEITKQGIDQRFTVRSVEFMKVVLERLLTKIISQQPVTDSLSTFTSVRIKDSTSFQLPEDMVDKYPGSGGSGSKATIRIQFEFDYKTGKVYDLSLHPFNNHDQTNAKDTIETINKGDLIIRDLGYINLFVLRRIAKEAFYLNRLNSAYAYELKNGQFVLLDFVKVKAYLDKYNLNCIEKEVYLGEKKEFKTRMIIERMPEKEVTERLRKAAKEARNKKRELTKDYKSRAALNIFITNVDSQIVPNDQVRTLYRLRWQVEIIFKVWKSVGKIHGIKEMKTPRFETLLYAKLIQIMMNWAMLWEIGKVLWLTEKKIISPIKFFKTLKDRLYSLWQAFTSGVNKVASFITELYEMSARNHRLEKKKKQLSSIEILLTFIIQS